MPLICSDPYKWQYSYERWSLQTATLMNGHPYRRRFLQTVILTNGDSYEWSSLQTAILTNSDPHKRRLLWMVILSDGNSYKQWSLQTATLMNGHPYRRWFLQTVILTNGDSYEWSSLQTAILTNSDPYKRRLLWMVILTDAESCKCTREGSYSKSYTVFLGSSPKNIQHINPFTPKSDQCQISPVASPEILHHTVWRTWLFLAYSDERWLYYQFSLPHLYIFLSKRLGDCTFWSQDWKG